MDYYNYPVTAGGVGITASAIQATLEPPAAGNDKCRRRYGVGINPVLVDPSQLV
jgi:hypothetical protein